jgi:TRAP-type mannitol/chloroaromatic compound transport system permease small subunit
VGVTWALHSAWCSGRAWQRAGRSAAPFSGLSGRVDREPDGDTEPVNRQLQRHMSWEIDGMFHKFHKARAIIDKAIDRLSRGSLLISSAMILIMVFATTYGVVRRYAFHRPDQYSYEISMIFLLLSFLFAVSSVERLNEHIRVDFISDHLPKRLQHVLLQIITPIMGITFVTVLMVKGWTLAVYSFTSGEHSTTAWREALGYVKIWVPIGYTVLLLTILSRLFKGICALCHWRPPDESAPLDPADGMVAGTVEEA